MRSQLDALAWLRTTTKPRMFARIADRLREVLPEAYLPALQAVLTTTETSTPDNVIRLDRRAPASA